MKLTIKEAMNNENVEYRQFYNSLQDKEIGYWDGINSTDTIQSYITDMMKDGVRVSHILEALETNECEYDD